jgi:pyruvate kinase
MSKLEKPAAIDNLDEIVSLSDGIMIARGDLSVSSSRAGSGHTTENRACLPAAGKARSRRDANARIDDRFARSNAGRSIGRCHGGLRRSRRRDVVGGISQRRYPREAVSMMDSIIKGAEGEANAGLYGKAEHDETSRSHADAICSALGVTTHSSRPMLPLLIPSQDHQASGPHESDHRRRYSA